MKKTHTKLYVTLTSICAVLGGISLAALLVIQENGFTTQINSALNVPTYKTVDNGGKKTDTNYYPSAYSDDAALASHEKEVCENLEAEGAVLLKNDNNTLPLAKTTKFSLFSTSSVDPVYGGTGSGQVNISDATTLRGGLNEAFAPKCTNSTLWKHYTNDLKQYRRINAATTGGKIDDYKINEAPWNEVITSEVEDSFREYGDCALVVLARSGGEGNDLPMKECSDGTDGDYLRLSKNEIDMLKGLKAYKDKGTFKKIVVLLNGSNTLQLDFLDQAEYGIDACLWIGDPGTHGFGAVAKILSGDINPSGRLSDTFLKDNQSSPAAKNFGLHAYTNSSASGMSGEYTTSWVQYNQMGQTDKCNENYIVYQEDIYVGYKYYETRYEDYVMGTGNAGDYSYQNEVEYPFGYGLSYTTFSYHDLKVEEENDHYNVEVTVRNDGSKAGKHAVEVYVQTPYTDYDKKNGVEKASVQLASFAKTDTLAPNAEETVKLTVNKRDIASYDANEAKTYILDAGDYLFTVAPNAHEAVNNFLAEKNYTTTSTADRMDKEGDKNMVKAINQSVFDSETCSTSEETGAKITNQFDHVDINKYEGTKNDEPIAYLTRSDWKGTFPDGSYSMKITPKMWEDGLDYSKEGRKKIVQKMEDTYYADEKEKEVPATGVSGTYVAVMFHDKGYDEDCGWENLISQASLADMDTLTANGFHTTQAIASLGLPATLDENGPQGYTKSLMNGNSGMGYTSEDIMASTRNVDLLKDMGECIGEDVQRANQGSDGTKTGGLYGPAANIHRTPYDGRNFEYYSEDSLLTKRMLEPEVRAIQSKGIYVFTKHFALNDQESGRYGLGTWANEQSIREIYLRGFEGNALGGGSGVMSSFNRLGVVWAGADYGLMTEVLRNEWGMKGAAITDCSVFADFMDRAAGLLAGQNLWDGTSGASDLASFESTYQNDPVMVRRLQESTKRIVYSISHSHIMNGLSSDMSIVSITPWYMVTLQTMAIVFLVAAAVFFVFIFLDRFFFAKKEPETKAEEKK